MAASEAARYDLKTVHYSYIWYGVKASTAIYSGTAVGVAADGFLVPMANTAGLKYVGISRQTITGTDTDGEAKCQVEPPSSARYIVFNITSPTAALVGDRVYFTDDHTVSATEGNSADAGVVVEVLDTSSAGKVVVDTEAANPI